MPVGDVGPYGDEVLSVTSCTTVLARYRDGKNGQEKVGKFDIYGNGDVYAYIESRDGTSLRKCLATFATKLKAAVEAKGL